MSAQLERAPRPVDGPVVLGLTACAFVVRLVGFLGTPHPLGTDGYYYVVQASSWSRALHVPDSSWMLRLLGLVATVVEPVLATKLTACALAALCVPAFWWLGEQVGAGRGRWLGAWAAASPTLTHLAAEFPKNLAMAAPYAVFCGALLRRRWGLALVSGLLAATAHKLGAVLVVAALVGALLDARSPRLLGALVLGGAVIGVLAGLPGTLHPGEGFRLAGQIAPGSGWPPVCWFDQVTLSAVQRAELVLAGLGALVGLVRLRQPLTPMLLPVLLLAVLPLWNADVLDLGYRLTLISPLLAAPLLLTPLRPPSVAWLFLGLPLANLGVPGSMPPYERFEAVVARIPEPLPELLVAHQGINFLYHHRTGREAMAWAPDPWLDPERVGRVAWGIRESEWVAAGVERVHLVGPYSYLTEAEWQRFRNLAESWEDDGLVERLRDWHNPSGVRPAALVRGRR